MKVKTSELIGPALDWAVAKCEGREVDHDFMLNGVQMPGWFIRVESNWWRPLEACSYSTDWLQGGPIIEREIFKLFRNVGGTFTAQIKVRVPYYSPTYSADIGRDEVISASGPTPLIAAMRAYVASNLGEEVDVPDELK